jgi:hypothetical protein
LKFQYILYRKTFFNGISNFQEYFSELNRDASKAYMVIFFGK